MHVRFLAGISLFLLLGAGSLCARQQEAQSRFGEVVLSRCDLIVLGVASATRKQAGGCFQVTLTVQQVVHGESRATDLQIFFTDAALLPEDKATRGLFALKDMAAGGKELLGRPIAVPDGDFEEDAKIAVVEDFLALEDLEPGEERTQAFEDLLAAHFGQGGWPAANAAVELIYWVSRRPGDVTRARFDRFRVFYEDPARALETRTRLDVKLALGGMVEARIKSLCFKQVRRGETAKERRAAYEELDSFLEIWPSAFLEADAKLCEALADTKQGGELRSELLDMARRIRAEIKLRKAAEEADKPGGGG